MSASAALNFCSQCGLTMPPSAVSCPGCHALVYSERLKELAAEAQQAEQRGDLSNALSNWRSALELLPQGSSQYAGVQQQVLRLSSRVDTEAPVAPPSSWKKRSAALGPIGAALWKFKVFIWLVLTKAKLLLLGFTKMGTLLSMLASFGVYWTLFGWMFAAGFVLCIYIHEMGHVIKLRQFGIKATAPMFIPGLGALVRLKQYPANALEDARVGLAGPIYGLGAAFVCLGLFVGTGMPIFAALTRTTAWINLFNLVPIWQLDGSRGLRALSRQQRFILMAVVGLAALLTHDGILVMILAVMAFRTFSDKTAPDMGDTTATIQYSGLIAALSILCMVPAQHP